MTQLNLAECAADGKAKNLSGEDRGLHARDRFRMDELDRGADAVTVIVPDYVYAVSTSFFCGMFGGSYNALGGRNGLLEKYKFKAPPELWPQIEQGLERCSYDFQPPVACGRS